MIRRKRLVRVHFREPDDLSIEGVLLGRAGDFYRLAGGRHLAEDAKRTIDGETLIPRDRVLYIQVIG